MDVGSGTGVGDGVMVGVGDGVGVKVGVGVGTGVGDGVMVGVGDGVGVKVGVTVGVGGAGVGVGSAEVQAATRPPISTRESVATTYQSRRFIRLPSGENDMEIKPRRTRMLRRY